MSRGTGWERGKVCVGGAGHSHVAFLSAAETASFLETFFPFLWGKLLRFFIGVNVHGIGVPGRSVPSGGGGMESDRSSGRMLFGNRGCKVLLTEELVNFLIPSLGCGGDYFHPIDLVGEPDWYSGIEVVDNSYGMGSGVEFCFDNFGLNSPIYFGR